jgi:uncharacterized protein (TIGR03435 family)
VVGPPWLDQDRFDIAAKVAAGATKEQVNPMLQNLLMERFSLTFHRETRDLPVYELVVVKGGLKMKEAAKPPGATPAALPLGPSQIVRGKDGSDELGSGSRGWVLITGKEPGTKRISARSQTVAEVIPLFQTLLGRSVVDKTGLTGTYDFNVDFVLYEPGLAGIGSPSAPEPPSEQATPADGVSIPSMGLIGALESRLGLKMVAGKGPVEVLVVDRVNRQPTEN